MRVLAGTVTILLGLSVAPLLSAATGECYPRSAPVHPTIPDGATASVAELQHARREVQAYVLYIEQKLACHPYIDGLQFVRLLRRAQRMADAFNAQRLVFLQRTQSVAGAQE